MARQPKPGTGKKPAAKEKATVQQISNEPVEPMPEEGGTMTNAAAAAAPRDPVDKGPAKAVAQATAKPNVQWFRVLADRNIMGATGFRAKIRAGKEINNTMYNIEKLKRQGVQLQPIREEERLQL